MSSTRKKGPVTPEERAEVEAAIRSGKARNEIAREFGRSGRTVSSIAEEAGLSFDRADTWRATAARKADLAERRSVLSEQLLLDAERLLDQLWSPATVYSFSAKSGYQEASLPEPTPRDKRELMTAAAIAIDKSLLLDAQHDSAGELSAFDAWLEYQIGSRLDPSKSRDDVIAELKAAPPLRSA